MDLSRPQTGMPRPGVETEKKRCYTRQDMPEGLDKGSTIDARSLAPPTPEVLESSAYLLVFAGDSSRMVALPSQGDFDIGRGDSCHLRFDEHRVSRLHARFSLNNGQARLADMGSHNGTLVNDEALVGQRSLVSGDIVTIAGFTLVYHTSAKASRVGILDVATFRARAELELERAARFTRPLAVVDVAFGPSADKPRLQPLIENVLRRVDLVSWTGPERLGAVLPECDADEAQSLVQRLLEALEPIHAQLRAGIAVYPDDGADVEGLTAAARTAAGNAGLGEVTLAAAAFQVLAVGEREVVVADPTMVRLYDLVKRLAKSELSVLVHGETGSGKELVASALHAFSPRSSKRLLAVNCAALQETLLESELFGHERGAFTGALTAKPGLLEAANGGTVFLDEVGEMSPALQAKLLRALETRRITRVGDTKERDIDLRVVAATHKDLQAEVKAGRFREDLFFRLAGATVWLPPLRNRKREMLLLARRFLEDACRRAGRSTPVLAPDTMQRLAAYPWPGNVRELRNVIDFLAATVTDEVIYPWHLDARLPRDNTLGAVSPPPSVDVLQGGVSFRPLADEIRELEQKRMLEALAATGWNQTRAANALQMPLRTFVTRFKQYGLNRHGKV